LSWLILIVVKALGLQLNDRVPDEKTIWLFRDELTTAKLIDWLFDQFDETLSSNGFAAEKGQIIDATIVSAPKQRNSREENKQIKEEGKAPETWDSKPNKKRQKDTDARWTKKRNVSNTVRHKICATEAWQFTQFSWTCALRFDRS